MKKILNNICMLALMTVAGVAFVSCEKEAKPVSGQFTMNVEASMPSDGGAKQLTLDGSTLHATWAAGEQVKVYNGSDELGTLTPQNISDNGRSCRLSGTLTGTIAVNDVLTLKFGNPDYASQDGTLAYIAAHCDYAEASVTVSGISGGNITTTGHANFVNQQAIVKFTLKNTSDAAISVTPLKVSDGTHTYTVTPASATSEIYVAMPGFNGQTVKLTATTGIDLYKYKRTGVTLTNGQYYEIEVKMDLQGYVNLGLPSGTLWATCNVGAFEPEDYGDKYAWAATETWYISQNPYVWKPGKEGGYIAENAPYYSNGTYTKYTTDTDTLEFMDDAAYANWGSSWRIPTEAQWLELFSECDWEATTVNGVSGYKFSKDGNYIFLPASNIYSTASLGYNNGILYCMYASLNDKKTYHTSRNWGFPVRPVRVKKATT